MILDRAGTVSGDVEEAIHSFAYIVGRYSSAGEVERAIHDFKAMGMSGKQQCFVMILNGHLFSEREIVKRNCSGQKLEIVLCSRN